MPWKETDAVELRREFVLRAMQGEIPFLRLCEEYGISTKTGYKWKERFEQDGARGLRDQSRRPRSSPQQIGEDELCAVISLKCAHQRWGPKKIRELLAKQYAGDEAASLSTVKRILKKAGLVQARRSRSSGECGGSKTGSRLRRPMRFGRQTSKDTGTARNANGSSR